MIAFGIVLFLFTGCKSKEQDLYYAKMEIEDYGTILLELDHQTAPLTVENFVKLANDGFYDGLTFHRVVDGFMIQGGDPLGNGLGGSGTTIKGEFSANGINNTISHIRGTISMARSDDYDSASSQFFIVQQASLHLNGQYAAFGHVIEGMDIVDAICKNTPTEEDGETVAKENQPIIRSVRTARSLEELS